MTADHELLRQAVFTLQPQALKEVFDKTDKERNSLYSKFQSLGSRALSTEGGSTVGERLDLFCTMVEKASKMPMPEPKQGLKSAFDALCQSADPRFIQRIVEYFQQPDRWKDIFNPYLEMAIKASGTHGYTKPIQAWSSPLKLDR